MTVEDILLILVFLYSLTGGQDCYDSPMEEEQIKVSLYVLSILKRWILSVEFRQTLALSVTRWGAGAYC